MLLFQCKADESDSINTSDNSDATPRISELSDTSGSSDTKGAIKAKEIAKRKSLRK